MSSLRPAKRLFPKGESTAEKIYLATIQPDKYTLTAVQQEIKTRWKTAFALAIKGEPQSAVIAKLVEVCGVSESQAFLDIKNSEHYYGEINKVAVDTDRAIIRERINIVWKLAQGKKDIQMMLRAIEQQAKLIDEKDPAYFNPEKFENVETGITLPPVLLEMFMEQVKSGVMDFNKIKTEDAAFIEIDK